MNLDTETFERVRQYLVRALVGQLRHYDGTEPCKRWPDDRLERVVTEAVTDAMRGIALVIYPAATIDAKAALGKRAGSYASDARKFLDAATLGTPVLTPEDDARWASICGVIADELRKSRRACRGDTHS